MERACQECGEKIVGRIDKKFCCDYCRNTFHNNLNRERKKILRNINSLLRKNYRILEELNPSQKSKTNKTTLLLKGFRFDYFTSIYTTKSGNVYYFVYDQGYLPLDEENYALVRRF